MKEMDSRQTSMDREEIKRAVGRKGAEFVRDGMVVGLGTGSTTSYFIERLIERYQEGLKIQVVASSKRSYEKAKRGGLPLLDVNELCIVDLTLDGADEIDEQKRMIKGGGGALVREKILASMSKELIILIDESKLVSALGKHPLAVEVIPFGIKATVHHLEKAGYKGVVRMDEKGKPYLTDNGNVIIDVHFPCVRENPERDHALIRSIPGVVDTGFFFNLAGRVVVGFNDGQITVK